MSCFGFSQTTNHIDSVILNDSSLKLKDAIFKPIPSISNSDTGIVDINVKIDSLGNVISVILKTITGNVSEDSIRFLIDCAWKTKFSHSNVAIRRGTLKYNLVNY